MFLESLRSDPQLFFSVIITVVVSIVLHELAHGIVAIAFGDRTPIETGHMTLNPIVHMGAMSLVLLVVAGISWGQMPVNPRRMRGKYADAIVSLAGPATNALLGVIALLILGLWVRFTGGVDPSRTVAHNAAYFLLIFGYVNFTLAIFNCIPIPPLDGARILAGISSSYARAMLAMRGQLGIAFLLIFIFAGQYISDAGNETGSRFLGLVSGRPAVVHRPNPPAQAETPTPD